MLNFELVNHKGRLSKTKPKLQNISIVALQTYKQYLLVSISFLLLCGTAIYSQDIQPKSEVNIPAKENQDTLAINVNNIIIIKYV